ncbi:MAG: GFA family protein [Cellvibrionaceae bacterium]
MAQLLSGECLCGDVSFTVKDDFKMFYQCHCKQCQQLTGSAFASNLSTEPTNIEWLRGEDKVTMYEHPRREFSKSFCQQCGSALPFLNKTRTSLIIPAGCLNQLPALQPQANIFTEEQAPWLASGACAKSFSGFPE